MVYVAKGMYPDNYKKLQTCPKIFYQTIKSYF